MNCSTVLKVIRRELPEVRHDRLEPARDGGIVWYLADLAGRRRCVVAETAFEFSFGTIGGGRVEKSDAAIAHDLVRALREGGK